ncbi:helix-turn-helix transcriptional regulator [Kibdelosporangium philippinense]|uniref:Helix-turn-helix transcriptional regulator n=1 Tax=Kibdelosporangium philippinense TaxID=211113 RepID=A0ABS8ZHN8_9PSEU|nr:helix-turn-helix transcriptional regulator [Kibdelosporangium philippinense]MCE7006583.1 helix-turn-helix transcriptional regulator [Kibdelosporangium philippinense]
MTSSVHQAREALGQRLRDLRKNAGLSGVGLAARAGWTNSSKVSKIEHGKQTPSEDDIRAWCQHTGAAEQIPDLIATVRNIEAMYVEWRRMLEVGTRRRQHASKTIEAETQLMRWFEPVLVPGLLHTAAYARAVMRRVIDFYRIPDDLEAGVAARMERQQILYRGTQRFHFVIAHQALLTTVGSTEVMIGQLDRLLAVTSLTRVTFGILPTDAEYRVPTNQFIMFDDRLVNVETISAELAVSQPREIALYGRAFNELAQQAVYGQAARGLISRALEKRRAGQAAEEEAAPLPKPEA